MAVLVLIVVFMIVLPIFFILIWWSLSKRGKKMEDKFENNYDKDVFTYREKRSKKKRCKSCKQVRTIISYYSKI